MAVEKNYEIYVHPAGKDPERWHTGWTTRDSVTEAGAVAQFDALCHSAQRRPGALKVAGAETWQSIQLLGPNGFSRRWKRETIKPTEVGSVDDVLGKKKRVEDEDPSDELSTAAIVAVTESIVDAFADSSSPDPAPDPAPDFGGFDGGESGGGGGGADF